MASTEQAVAQPCDQPVAASAPLLQWTVHPAAGRPLAALGAGLFVGLAGLAMLAATGSPLLGLITAATVLLAAAEFLCPSRYRVTEAGIERDLLGTRRLAWDEIRAVYRLADGLKLSTQSRPGPLEAHRGLFVPYGEVGDELRRLVDQRATRRRRPGEAP